MKRAVSFGAALVGIASSVLLFGARGEGQQAVTPGNFVDVTEKTGIHFQGVAWHTPKKYLIETMGSGVALFDYDNDGRLDIFLVNGASLEGAIHGSVPKKTGPEAWNRLYHQKADGTFEDVTEHAGLQGVGYGMGVAAGDFDNDGYEDLYVTAYGGNKLYHNNGDGTFADVTEKAGVGGSGWSTSAAWVDLDRDGLLDLVVLRYITWDFDDVYCGEPTAGGRGYCHPDVFQPISPLIFHNDGNGHFTDIAPKSALGKPAKALGIAIGDYDCDGITDLFVANDSMVEYLYHGKPDGTFEEIGLLSGTAVDEDGQTYAGMGVDFADYDNDGFPDLVVDALANQKYSLYHNNRDGTFTYSTQRAGLTKVTLKHSGWGLRFFDYDNDGWKDLMIVQGHDLDTIEKTAPDLHYREPMLLLHNSRTRFDDVSAQSGDAFRQAWVARGLAIGDIDNDGRVDAVVTTNGGPAHVIHNETATAHHWLTLAFRGHKSNRDGIGATVKVVTAAGPQFFTVTTSSSYLSSGDKRVYVGLGDSPEAKQVEIRWPSGITQTLANVKGDRMVTIEEGSK